jgi:hypothetical protein
VKAILIGGPADGRHYEISDPVYPVLVVPVIGSDDLLEKVHYRRIKVAEMRHQLNWWQELELKMHPLPETSLAFYLFEGTTP